MGFEDLVIIKVLNNVTDWINDNIDSSILNGLSYIILFILLLWFLGYFMIYGLIQKHFTRFFVIIGIWLVLEISNLVGGGHDKSIR